MAKTGRIVFFQKGKHPIKIKIINFLLIGVFSFLMVGCNAGEKSRSDLFKLDKESLEKELKNAPAESEKRVDILNELAHRERRSGLKKPPEKDALTYAEDAWKLATKLGYEKGEIEALYSKGNIYFFRSEYECSLEFSNAGLQHSLGIGWRRGQAMAHNSIARYYQVMGQYEKALENFFKAKEISEAIHEKREEAYANYGIGALLYYDQKDYSLALDNFRKYLKLGYEINDTDIISSGLFAIGEMHRSSKAFHVAKKFFEKCRIISEKYGYQYNEANAYEGYGDMFSDENNFDAALSYYQKSLDLFKKTGDQFQVISVNLRLGRLYIKKEDYKKEKKEKKEKYKEALEYLKKAFTLAEEKKIPLRMKESCEEIIKAYLEQGDSQTAAAYFNTYKEKTDFLAKNNMLRLELFYEHNKKIAREKIIRSGWIAGFLIVLATTMLLLLNFEKLKRSKTALEKSYQDIAQMSEIGQAITSSLSVKDIIDKVYENVNELMDATVFTIAVYNPEKQWLDLQASKEYGCDLPFRYYELSDENRLAVYCFKNEVGIRLGDYQKEYGQYISEIKPPLRGDTFNSHIFLPLLIKDEKIEGGKKKIGVITVQSKKKNAYSDYHYNILKNLAVYVAIALDNANAYKQIEEQKARLEQQALELEEKKFQLEKTVQIEKEINQFKEELMYTVSHQYKTPLAIIKGSVQMFRDYFHKLNESDIQKYLNKIFTNLDYMNYLIESLLNFGRKYNPGHYDLRDLCKKVVESIKADEGSKHNIEFETAGDCSKVKIDKDFIEIILSNLLTNSIKYSDAGSKIIVDIACDTDNAIIKVIDNGMGIPNDYLKMKFKRFHRGSNVAPIRGTGIGLALVKRYVDLHNGHIDIKSQLEKGTTITVTLPKN